MHTIRTAMLVFFLLTATASAYAQESYPSFDEDHWANEKEQATGKIRRGVGLTVLGLATIAPSAILIKRTTDNPEKYLAWSAAVGIAAVGMIGHGLGSVGFGDKQRDQANSFIKKYQSDPASVDVERERDAYMHDRKKSAVKLILFGSVVSLQGALLVSNGIALSVMQSRGNGIGGATIWPSYLVGGLLLSAGTAVVILAAVKYQNLDALASQPLPVAGNVSVSPYYYRDMLNGGQNFGLMGTVGF